MLPEHTEAVAHELSPRHAPHTQLPAARLRLPRALQVWRRDHTKALLHSVPRACWIAKNNQDPCSAGRIPGLIAVAQPPGQAGGSTVVSGPGPECDKRLRSLLSWLWHGLMHGCLVSFLHLAPTEWSFLRTDAPTAGLPSHLPPGSCLPEPWHGDKDGSRQGRQHCSLWGCPALPWSPLPPMDLQLQCRAERACPELQGLWDPTAPCNGSLQCLRGEGLLHGTP